MPRTITDIEADLVTTRACINRQLEGDVSSFEHEGGDMATMIPLNQLIAREQYLIKQLAGARRAGARFIPARMLD